MRDHIFKFHDESTERKFLEMAGADQVRTHWVAVDPNPQFNGEYQFASEEIWNDISASVQQIIKDNTPEGDQDPPPWPKTPFKEWARDDRRSLIFLAVQEFDCVGDRLPETPNVMKAFRERRLPDPPPGRAEFNH